MACCAPEDARPGHVPFPGLRAGGNKYRRAWGRQVSIRGYRKRLRDVADVLEQDRSQKHQQGERHTFDDFPLDRLGTHSFKRSAVVLMKDTCTSTALVGAIAGTTAKTLDRVYDTPTWKRRQTLVTKTFHPLADTLRPRQATGQEAPSVGFYSQCGNTRESSYWTSCPWCGHAF